MVQFDYNGVMKRYDVKVPFTLAEEQDVVVVASISEDNRITLHRDLSLRLLKQIILKWDEKEHMDTMRAKREAGEFDKYFDDTTKPKNEKLTYLEERLLTSSWKDVSIDELEWFKRTWYVLNTAGIRTIGELVEKKEADLYKLKN